MQLDFDSDISVTYMAKDKSIRNSEREHLMDLMYLTWIFDMNKSLVSLKYKVSEFSIRPQAQTVAKQNMSQII